MSTKLIISLLCFALILILVVLEILRRGRIQIKYAIVWFIPALAIIVLALFPNLFVRIARIFGFQTISSLVIGALLILLALIIMSLTVIIAGQTTKITLLIQEVSTLKKRVDDLSKDNQ